MTPERLGQIQELYHLALDREPDARAAFLSQACHGDDELRREVESLLAQNGANPGDVMEKPAMEIAADLLATGELNPGAQLGPYRIEGMLGAGGMGCVYKARDTRLGRFVAIKVARARFSERFRREARAISALNHPNICTLYDVGPNYLVMELVEGPTLAGRIRRGPIPLDEALGIARQIADGLAAAHEEGVIHRDLKPANIKIKPDGVVKVLDFGLAKQSRDREGADESTVTLTGAGSIMGTAAYMSPEQARGEDADKRADIWAFGAVLYEMVTGRRLFQGENTTEILASVIKEEPDLDRAPAQARPLLRRCLEKDSKRRLRDIGDYPLLLNGGAESPAQAKARPTAWVIAAATIAAALGLAALALAGFYFWPRPEPIPDVTRFEIAQPAGVAFSDNIVLSPDGRKLAYIATASNGAQLWIRSMDSAEARPLAGTERAVGTPIWSPDSRYVAFSGQGKLQKIEASGGATQTLCAAPGAVNGGFWTGDDKILFAINANSGLLQVGASGGEPAPVTTLANDEARHAFPSLLPDGRHFVYARASTATVGGIYLSPLDAKPTDPPKKLLPDISRVVFAPASGPGSNSNGYLLFLRSGTLMAQPFDARKLELAGAAVPLAERVSSQVTIAAFSGAFSASGNGSLVYRTGGSGGPQQVTWFDRDGKPVGTFGDAAPPEMYASAPAVSPDGKRVALTRNDAQAGSTDIWLFEFARGATTRFTFGPGASTNPVWSPDGSRIVFLVHRGGAWGIYRKASNLVGGEELLYKSPAGILLPTSWSRDGKFLLFQTGGAGVLALPMEGEERKPIPLLPRDFNQRGARFSPDGRYISYVSNESGRDEIYVRTFDPAGGANSPSGGKWQVSRDGAVSAHWRADGRELLWTSPNGTIMSVDVATAPVFQSGVPKPLFRALSAGGANWDVSADGKRVVLSVPVGANPAAPYTVVLNWTSLLRR